MVAAPYSETITTAVGRPVDFASGRSSVAIFNNSTETIFLGVDESLTTSNGIPLKAGQIIVFSRDFGDNPDLARYAVAASGSNNVRISEEFGVSLVELIEKNFKLK